MEERGAMGSFLCNSMCVSEMKVCVLEERIEG